MPIELASFYSRTQKARKIIVVDLGYLGDTVHLVPALWEIKRGYPEAALHVLTSPVGAELLRLAACVDRAWALNREPGSARFSEQLKMIKALRRERFDIAFNFSGADRTIVMTALTGARWRLAHPGGRRHFWNRWLISEWAPRQDRDLIVFEQRRRVLAGAGLKLDPPKFGFQIEPAAGQWAKTIVPEGAIHVSPNSSKLTREWPIEHHATMMRMLWERAPELRIIISASDKERERERLRQLAGMIKDERLRILDEVPTISQLAGLLKRSRVHVGPDSGVLHLAFALDVPTVSFFREQGAYKSFMPNGPRHRVISVPCRCIDSQNAPCEKTGRAECFEQITPARVALLVNEQLRLA